ncbi:protein phosphatase 2C 14 [Hirschfeldia incana]|nr:protein phosphatase 2C 14 [Hirschfeldia incana]
METRLSMAPKLPSLKRKRPPQIEIPNILQEIQTDNLRFRDHDSAARQNDAVCFGGNGFGVVSRKGKKKFMEDSHRVAVGTSNNSFFGVYDGHGGCKAADFVAENLHKHVLEMVKDCKDKGEKEEAFKAAYLRTDNDFLEEGVVSGACCVTALIQNQEMVVSNLGDCRAVLCRGGVAESLTTDHRAGRDDERERIESQGGYVEFHRGAWRVHGILAISRSIGDAHLKKWVVAEPETRVLDLEDDMEFLVLASDGLWDVVSNQEAVDIVLSVQGQRKTPRESEDENLFKGLVNVSPSSKLRRVSLVKCAKPYHSENESPYHEMGSPPSKARKITALKRIKMKSESSWVKEASKELVNLAVSRGSMDDITVVIVDLNHYKC